MTQEQPEEKCTCEFRSYMGTAPINQDCKIHFYGQPEEKCDCGRDDAYKGVLASVVPHLKHCVKFTLPEAPEWEKEFDKEFVHPTVVGQDDNLDTYEVFGPGKKVKAIKDFIRSLHNETLEEAAEALEKQKKFKTPQTVINAIESAQATIRSLKK